MEEHAFIVKYSGWALKQYHNGEKRGKRLYWLSLILPNGQTGYYHNPEYYEKPYTARKLKEMLKRTVKISSKGVLFNSKAKKEKEINEEDLISEEMLRTMEEEEN